MLYTAGEIILFLIASAAIGVLVGYFRWGRTTASSSTEEANLAATAHRHAKAGCGRRIRRNQARGGTPGGADPLRRPTSSYQGVGARYSTLSDIPERRTRWVLGTDQREVDALQPERSRQVRPRPRPGDLGIGRRSSPHERQGEIGSGTIGAV